MKAVFEPLWRLIASSLHDLGLSGDEASFDLHMGTPDERDVD